MVGENPPEPVPNEGGGSGKGKFDGLDKIKPPYISNLLCSRPNNVLSGIVAGVGNTTGSILLAVGKMKPGKISANVALVTT